MTLARFNRITIKLVSFSGWHGDASQRVSARSAPCQDPLKAGKIDLGEKYSSIIM